jgi:hypothetical protein
MNQELTELTDLDIATKLLTSEFFETHPEIARKIFDYMLEIVGDSDLDLKAKIQFQRGWFTVPGFRQQVTDYLWNSFTDKYPELK